LGYTKLDDNLTTSSIWFEDDKTLRVWVFLMAEADARGWVTHTVPSIAGACRYDVETTDAILQKLASPDKYSRTPDQDGRRITIVREPEFAVFLVNHAKYRAKAHTDAERAAAYRARNAPSRPVTKRDDDRDERHAASRKTEDRRQKTNVNGSIQTRAREDQGPKANPFIGPGDRPRWETEALQLTAQIAELKSMDGAEVFRQAAGYQGARRAGCNPANLTDDRLVNTVLDLRTMLKQAQAEQTDRERHGNV
jgi:hypothetical protein